MGLRQARARSTHQMMSGLNDVLGNVYGTAADKPQETNLEDVKESMDALLEHADKSMDAPASESTTDVSEAEPSAAPEQPEAFDALPAEISDDWVPGGEDPIDDDLFSADEEIGFDDDSAFVGSATPEVDDRSAASSRDSGHHCVESLLVETQRSFERVFVRLVARVALVRVRRTLRQACQRLSSERAEAKVAT